MILLALESATDTVGAAVLGDAGSAERTHVGGRAHAENLVPAVEEACALTGCRVTDVDRIAVDVGPGLFTGLRVGVATAKALGQALGVGVLGVGSLDILAMAAHERAGGGAAGPVVAVVDARRGEVFAAAYLFDGAGGQPTDPASVRRDRPGPLTPAALAAWLGDLSARYARVTVVGDGALRYRDVLSVGAALDFGFADSLAAPPPLVQARLARQRLAEGAVPADPVDVVPDYRRPADARVNWEQRTPRAPGTAEGGAVGRR